MASRNLEQGIRSIQQQDMITGKRLIKIALKNDNLNVQEQVQAFTWLAEADKNPQFKVEQYQAAIRLDPTNQDVLNRLSYWSSVLQQQNQADPAAQNMPPQNQNQQPGQNQQTGWQNFQQQQFSQQYTPSQGMPPVQPPPPQQQQQFNQQFTPSQGMPPVQSDSQQLNWQGNQHTPSQGMPAINNPYTTNQMPLHQTGTFPAVGPQFGQPGMIQLQDVQRTVGISGGSHGSGTGFFVTRDGLIATTRHVIGAERQVTVQLMDRRTMAGDVVRAFPMYDLALIQVNVQLMHLLGVTQAPMIPDDTPIVAVTHAGEGIRSAKRRSMHQIPSYWFPTIINHMKDAGGNPVFDANNALVGMLTANASRSNGYMYGLHIQRIYQCVDLYIHEKGQLAGQNTIYCNACGVVSRAPSFGGHFCENCGNTHPYAVNVHRYPQPNLAHLYGEDAVGACPKCGSKVGFYERECLRCGQGL